MNGGAVHRPDLAALAYALSETERVRASLARARRTVLELRRALKLEDERDWRALVAAHVAVRRPGDRPDSDAASGAPSQAAE